MRYEKPVVMELGSRAQHAAGQGLLACVGGASAVEWNESCGTGTGAGWSCGVGTGGGGQPLCIGGSTADPLGDCFGGSAVQYYCGVGTGAVGPDPNGCRVGPTP